MASQLFHQPSTDPVLVCKRCNFAVRPREVFRHLQSSNHRFSKPRARQIAEAIQTSDYAQECDEWQPPPVVNNPIPNLPVFSDGISCEMGQFCQFIARTENTMRQHWRDQHNWVAPKNPGGRPSQSTLSHGGWPSLADWGLWFCLNYGSKSGSSPDWEFTSRPDLEGVDCSDRLQILVSYNRVSEISTIRFGVCIAQ